jgi:hypothetical protein
MMSPMPMTASQSAQFPCHVPVQLLAPPAEVTGLTKERDAALDEVAGLRAALLQMTRRQNTALG